MLSILRKRKKHLKNYIANVNVFLKNDLIFLRKNRNVPLFGIFSKKTVYFLVSVKKSANTIIFRSTIIALH